MAFPSAEEIQKNTTHIDQSTYAADVEEKINKIIEIANRIIDKEEKKRQDLRDAPTWTGSKV